jgi:hypothetical protein
MVSETPGGTIVEVRVMPRAGRTRLAGVRGGALLVQLTAAPVEGAANDALVALLAERLDVPRRAISILSGARSRTKRVRVQGVPAGVVRERLETAAHGR